MEQNPSSRWTNLSDLHSLDGFQRAREKRRSLEEKTKILEENARVAKLSIDKQLMIQILQEEKRTHGDAMKELEEKLQEENRMHEDAIKELEEKIADLERQIKHSSEVENTSSKMVSEPAQELSEPAQEISNELDERERVDALQEHARALLQEPEHSEIGVPQEASRRKKRNIL